MIVSEEDALQRLSSPFNLMNRLSSSSNSSRRNSMGLFGIGNKDKNNKEDVKNNTSSKTRQPSFPNPFQVQAVTEAATEADDKHAETAESIAVQESAKEINQPNLDSLIDNADSQVKLGLAHDLALETLVDAVKIMKVKLDDIKPDKLPGVISATGKVVDQIQRQRLEANKDKGNRSVHFHFYTPTQKKMEDYNVIDVG